MEKEINKNKKKIQIKANTEGNKTFLLKKDFIYQETKTLILNKVVQKKELEPGKLAEKKQLNIATTNIIKLNEKNNNINKKILKISKISKTLGGKPILKNISLSLCKYLFYLIQCHTPVTGANRFLRTITIQEILLI